MKLRLMTVPFSHYCEKARWALDLTGLPYHEEKHVPGFHYAYNRANGVGPTIPALITADGVLTDSGDILMYAHRHGVMLYPKSQETEIRAWEGIFNKTLGPQTRVWAYANILAHPELFPVLLSTCPVIEQKLAKPFLPMF